MVNGIMALTNVAFFGLAGASLKLVRWSRERRWRRRRAVLCVGADGITPSQ